jgi:hypothetical protein
MDVLLGFAFAVLILVAIVWALGVTMKAVVTRHEGRKLAVLQEETEDAANSADLVEVAYTRDPVEARVWTRFLEDRGIQAQLEFRTRPTEPSPARSLLAVPLGLLGALAGVFWTSGEPVEGDVVGLRVHIEDRERAINELRQHRLVERR